MSELDLIRMLDLGNVSSWRIRVARWIESSAVQIFIVAAILLNSLILGLETFPGITAEYGVLLHRIDLFCLGIFVAELSIKLVIYRSLFWRNGWNWFDFIVVAIALVPSSGAFAVLRTLRVLRVLRLLTAVPALRKVVAAFLHSIPGLAGVIAIMAIFFFTTGVLATHMFGPTFPQWFGTLADSLFTLFQIMTLESWSMGIVRPVMEVHPFAWCFFVPFIVIATFTILNLFIGIIVSTMQELSDRPIVDQSKVELADLLQRMEADMKTLREMTLKQNSAR